MLATVLRLVRSLDRTLAKAVGEQEFERLRQGMGMIAEAFDPQGGLGHGDHAP